MSELDIVLIFYDTLPCVINWEVRWETVDRRRKALLEANGGAFVGLNAPELVDLVLHANDPREKIKSTSGRQDGFLFGGRVYPDARTARRLFGMEIPSSEEVRNN